MRALELFRYSESFIFLRVTPLTPIFTPTRTQSTPIYTQVHLL